MSNDAQTLIKGITMNTKLNNTQEQTAAKSSGLHPCLQADAAQQSLTWGFPEAKGYITERTMNTAFSRQLMGFAKANPILFKVEIDQKQKLVEWSCGGGGFLDVETVEFLEWFQESEFKDDQPVDILGWNRARINEGVDYDFHITFSLSEEKGVTPGNLVAAIEGLMRGQVEVGGHDWRMLRNFKPRDAGNESDYVLYATRYSIFDGRGITAQQDEDNKIWSVRGLLKALYRNHVPVHNHKVIPGVFYHQSVQEAFDFIDSLPALMQKVFRMKKEGKLGYLYEFDISRWKHFPQYQLTYDKWLSKKDNHVWLSAAMTREERNQMEWIYKMETNPLSI